MNELLATPRPGWFTAVAIVALIWNLLGLAAFVMQLMMTPEMIAALPAAEQDLYKTLPLWALAAFGAAVIGGWLGSLMLVLKRAWAVPLLLISLVGVCVQMAHSFFFSKTFEVYGPGGMIMPIMVLVFAFLLLWLSIHAKNNRWIR